MGGLFSSLMGGKKKKSKVVYVIDSEKREYVVIDGKLIPREKIIQIDPATNKVFYIDVDGSIKVAVIQLPEAVVKRLGSESKDKSVEMFL